MKGRVKWVEAMTFVAESESGHTLVMDGSPDVGGRNLGMRPMEMVLLGMAGCTAFDVVHILRRGRHQVTDCTIEVTAERAEEHPKVFTEIHVQYKVTGKGLTQAAVERAVTLSAETYCSASAMLGKTAKITHGHEIIEAE